MQNITILNNFFLVFFFFSQANINFFPEFI